MSEKEVKRQEMVARFYLRVCDAIRSRRRMSLTLLDPIKKRITIVVDPYYANLTWDLDFFMFAKRIQGPPTYGERKGWATIFLKEVYRFTLLPQTFGIDNSYSAFMEEFGHSLVRPSEYEVALCDPLSSPMGECVIS